MNKIQARHRRGKKTKAIIANSKLPRLVVFRSAKNIYVQVVIKGDKGDQVLSAASSLDKSLSHSSEQNDAKDAKEVSKAKKIKAKNASSKTDIAIKVGQMIAERTLQKGYKQVAFDRNGFMYHGRIKALADSARTAGLIF